MIGIDQAFLHKINTEILQSIVRRGEKYNLKHLLHLLREHLGADICYWFFLDERAILSMIVDGDEREVIPLPEASIAHELDLSRISSTPTLHLESARSLYGSAPLSSSLVIPLHEDGRLIAVIQFGSRAGRLSKDKAEQTIAIVKYLHNIYESFYEDMRRFELNRKMRSDLSQTERQFRILFEHTHDIVLSFFPDGLIRDVNEKGRIVLGLVEDPAHWRFEPVSPDLAFIDAQVANGDTISDIEVIIGDESRGIKFFIASFTPEMDMRNSVAVIHGIFKDITERVNVQKSLWQANLELSRAKELLESTQLQMVQQEKLASIGQLAAGIAHEINNPLGFIMSNHETLKGYLSKIDLYVKRLEGLVPNHESIRADSKAAKALSSYGELLADCDEGFDRIMRIIQSLKDFSRAETRGEIAPVLIEKLLNDTLVVSRNNWKYVAEVTTDYRLNEEVDAYGDLLNQVFMNMVVNAAQAISSQGRSAPGSIVIRTERQGDEAVITIEDDGPGIPEHALMRIFDPFYTTKPVGQGTGLGLSVSYDIIVKKHGGSIRAENKPEGGARFTVRLPMVQARSLTEVKEL